MKSPWKSFAKFRHRICSGSIALSLAVLSGVSTAPGATLLWDPNGTLPGDGGSGTWSINSVAWFDGTQHVVWSNSFGDTIADFQTNSTVNVDNEGGSTIFIGGLQFSNGTAHTVSGGTLTLQPVGALGGSPSIFANPGITATIGTSLTGPTGLVIEGGGRIILTGINSYDGLTLVREGELQLNHAPGGFSVPHDLTVGDGSLAADGVNGDAKATWLASFQLPTTSTVVVQRDGVLDLTGTSPTPHLQTIAKLTVYETNGTTGGLVQLKGSALTVDGLIQLQGGQIADVAGGSFLTANGNIDAVASDTIAAIGSGISLTLSATTVINVAQSAALSLAGDPELVISAHTSATNGRIYKDGKGTLRLANSVANAHTGGTFVALGTLELASTISDGAVPGDLTIGNGSPGQNSARVKLINDGQISDTSAIVINSDGLLELNTRFDTVGSVSGSGNISVFNGGRLNIGDTGVNTFSGVLIGNAAGAITKQGTGTMTISGDSNLYQGQFNITGGTLRTTNNFALGNSGTVRLQNSSTLSIGGTLTIGTFQWSSGDVSLAPGLGGELIVNNAFDKSVGSVGPYRYLIDAAGLQAGTYTITAFGTTNFVQNDLSYAFLNVPGNVVFQSELLLNPNSVVLTIAGATATGPLIQNSAPINTPTFADFTVNGPVQTGTPNESNRVNTLIFTPGSSLLIHNNLAVTSGAVNLVPGSSLTFDSSQPSSLSAGQLNVHFGSLLNGSGTVYGNLTNSGTVSPGNSPGKITVSGDYVQTSAGTLEIEISGRHEGEFDRLEVGGKASLDGRLHIAQRDGFKLKRGDQIEFLTAHGGVEGEFSDVSNSFTSDTILRPAVEYNEYSVTLEMVRGSFEELTKHFGLTPNQRAVAGALDQLADDQGNHKALLYLDERELHKLPGDFDKIAPEELTSIFTLASSFSDVQAGNIQRRGEELRRGGAGFSASGLAVQGSGPGYSGALTAQAAPAFQIGATGPTGNESKESKAPVVLDEKKWGVFLTGVGEWVDVQGDGNARGFDMTTGGFTLGLDYKVSPNFAIGIAAGYAGTAADLTDDGRLWVNGGKLGVYATAFAGGGYADFAVNGGINSYDTKRTGLGGTARGDTEGTELNVLVGTGYDWQLGGLSFGPTATFQYTRVDLDGFTEHGSVAPLEINDAESESLRSSFGVRASYDWRAGGVLIRPEIRAAWQHDYSDRAASLGASFAGGAEDDFRVSGPRLGRDSALLGAGVAIQWSETCTTYVNYDGEIGRDRYERHTVSGGVRVSF